jgi:hypothetical protein
MYELSDTELLFILINSILMCFTFVCLTKWMPPELIYAVC